jgi:hypothetical protein
MPVVHCPSCGRSGNLPAERLGQSLRCPGCGKSFQATAADPPAPQPFPRRAACAVALLGAASVAVAFLCGGGVGYLAGARLGLPPGAAPVALAQANAVPGAGEEQPPAAAPVKPAPSAPPPAPPAPAAAPAPPPPDEPALRLTARQLFDDYQGDLVTADQKYLGHVVELADVTGKVEKDERGRYYLGAVVARVVRLPPDSSPPRSVVEAIDRMNQASANARYLPGVVLYLDPAHAGAFAGLKPGQKITVRGKCAGSRKDPQTLTENWVVVEACVLVEGR